MSRVSEELKRAERRVRKQIKRTLHRLEHDPLLALGIIIPPFLPFALAEESIEEAQARGRRRIREQSNLVVTRAQEQAALDREDLGRAAEEVIAQQRAQFAAAGVDPDVGSAADVQRRVLTDVIREEERIKRNVTITAQDAKERRRQAKRSLRLQTIGIGQQAVGQLLSLGVGVLA